MALPPAAAPDDRRARDLRRRDGEGHAARRCQRLRPPGRLDERTRTEIKNMNSFNFIARGIDAEVERRSPSGSPATRCARRRTTSTRRPAHSLSIASRRRPTTTATSPSPTSCPSSRRPSSSRRCARRFPSRLLRGSAGSSRRSTSSGPQSSSPAGSTGCGTRPCRRAPTRSRRERHREHARRAGRPTTVPAPELAKLVKRDRIPRTAFDEAISKLGDPGFSADPYLAQEAVSDADELGPSSTASSRRTPARSPPTAAARKGSSASSSDRS